jgi:hypothetical protein
MGRRRSSPTRCEPMNTSAPARTLSRPLVAWALALLGLATSLWAPMAAAQADPPGRVGRIVQMALVSGGAVNSVPLWRYELEEGRWVPAARNRPFTSGDRLLTADDGRAELRIGSTVLRLAAATELEVLRLDDERLVFQLHAGSMALRVRTAETASEMEVITHEARAWPQRAGHYRFDKFERSAVSAEGSIASAWVGDLRVDSSLSVVISTGERLLLQRDGGGERWRDVPAPVGWVRGATQSDAFANWALLEDQRDEALAMAANGGSAAQPFNQPLMASEMTGAEDLYRYGAWQRHPEHGAVWLPNDVPRGWAPYRHGHWEWLRPWGWTWVDDAPWGFAPFHYGRWVSWQGRWAWWPGAVHARPVYSPAVVGWVGGGPGGVVLTVRGAPAVGWVPLAPREAWVPHYQSSAQYQQRLNQALPLPPVPRGERAHTNQVVPGAVTLVLRDVLVRHDSVYRSAVDSRHVAREHGHYTPPTGPQVRSYVPAAAGNATVLTPRGDQRSDPRSDSAGDGRRDPRSGSRGEARVDPRTAADRSVSPSAPAPSTSPARPSEPLVIMPAQVVNVPAARGPGSPAAAVPVSAPAPVAVPPTVTRPTYSDGPHPIGTERARDWRFEPNPRRGEADTRDGRDAREGNDSRRGRQPQSQPPAPAPQPAPSGPPPVQAPATAASPAVAPAPAQGQSASPKRAAPPPVEGRGDSAERKRNGAARETEAEGKR